MRETLEDERPSWLSQPQLSSQYSRVSGLSVTMLCRITVLFFCEPSQLTESWEVVHRCFRSLSFEMICNMAKLKHLVYEKCMLATYIYFSLPCIHLYFTS